MHMNLKPNKHKTISVNTTTNGIIGVHHSCDLPPPPLIKGGGVGVQNFLLERGDKPVKEGG